MVIIFHCHLLILSSCGFVSRYVCMQNFIRRSPGPEPASWLVIYRTFLSFLTEGKALAQSEDQTHIGLRK